jgi:hypothetical protein
MKFLKLFRPAVMLAFDAYEHHLRRLYPVSLTLIIVVFVISAVLMQFSTYDEGTSFERRSLGDFLLYKFSGNGYVITDVVKPLLLSLTALLATSFYRHVSRENNKEQFSFLHNIKMQEVAGLLGLLVVTVFIDLSLYYLTVVLTASLQEQVLHDWVIDVAFYLRECVPFVIMGFFIQYRLPQQPGIPSLRLILYFLIASLLIDILFFNSYNLIFNLLVRPLPGFFDIQEGLMFILRSVIAIPVIAFFIPTYTSIMAAPAMIAGITGADKKEGPDIIDHLIDKNP